MKEASNSDKPEVSMKLSKTVTMDHIFVKNVFEIYFIEKT